jgi:hypothetical protein
MLASTVQFSRYGRDYRLQTRRVPRTRGRSTRSGPIRQARHEGRSLDRRMRA